MRNKEWAGRLLKAMNRKALDKIDEANIIDLGTIQPDGSLLLDQFSVPVPPAGYLIAEWDFTVPDISRVVKLATPVTDDGEDTGGTAYSELTRIDFLDEDDRGLLADVRPRFNSGERVLVLWLSDEPVILCKVVSGDDA